MPEVIPCQGNPTKRARTRIQLKLAEVIRRHRKGTNLSQEAFAGHIGMHRTQYSFIERGIRDLRLSSLERVADGLQQRLSVLLSEAEDLSRNAADPFRNGHRSPERNLRKALTSTHRSPDPGR